MAKYVTRDELVAVEQRMIDALGKMVIEIDRNTTRQVVASEQRLRVELAGELTGQIVASEQRLRVELARDIVASEERIRSEIRGIDDQYRDLPERVARLEKHTGLER